MVGISSILGCGELRSLVGHVRVVVSLSRDVQSIDLMENCVEGGLAQARDLLAETSSAAQK